MAEKTALLAPMAKARVRMTVREKVGDLAKLGVHLLIGRALGKKGFPPGHDRLLVHGLQNVDHCSCQPLPVRFFARQLLAALRR